MVDFEKLLEKEKVKKQKLEYYKERFILDQYNHIKYKSTPITIEYNEDGTFKIC